MKNLKQRNNGGTIEFMTELVANCQAEIGQFYFQPKNQNYVTRIAVRIELPTHGGYACTGTTILFPVSYSGNLSLNSGYNMDASLPFQVTEGGRKVWDTFLNTLKDEMLEYIKTM